MEKNQNHRDMFFIPKNVKIKSQSLLIIEKRAKYSLGAGDKYFIYDFFPICNEYISNSLQNRDINIQYTNEFNTKAIYVHWSPLDFHWISIGSPLDFY